MSTEAGKRLLEILGVQARHVGLPHELTDDFPARIAAIEAEARALDRDALARWRSARARPSANANHATVALDGIVIYDPWASDEIAAASSRDLTPAQVRAVEALNTALVQARRARLAICGMDRNLLAYNGKAFDELVASGQFESAYEVQVELGQGIELAARGVYRESGGW